MIQSGKRRRNPSEPWQQVSKERNEHTPFVSLDLIRSSICVDTTLVIKSYQLSSLPFSIGETSINSMLILQFCPAFQQMASFSYCNCGRNLVFRGN